MADDDDHDDNNDADDEYILPHEDDSDDHEDDEEDDRKAKQFSLPVSRTVNHTNSGEDGVISVSSVLRECVNCGTQNTSQWRTNGSGHYLCNACGLYRKYNGEDRPPANTSIQRKRNCAIPKQCSNCGTLTSSMWRRTVNKQVACNACGLYYKLYGIQRPIEMRKDIVYPRNRYSKLSSATTAAITHLESVAPLLSLDDYNETFNSKSKQISDNINNISNNYIKSRQRTNLRHVSNHNKRQLSVESMPPYSSPLTKKSVIDDNITIKKEDDSTVSLPSYLPEPISLINSQSLTSCDDNGLSKMTDKSKECANCGTTSTSQWRRLSGIYFGHYLCNACGLYRKVNGEDRPLEESSFNYKKRQQPRDVKCTNCGVTKSSEWRRNQSGQIVCNACGLYYKLHSRNRPINMRRDFIAHRKRGPAMCAINVAQQQLSISGALTDDESNASNNYCNESNSNSESQQSYLSSAKTKRKQSNPKKFIALP